ncbi:MAG TPA: hypothetical protein VE152_00235, partial [Acidimicrobiales bacterium]|nr:hypothetical protein [Acidimicrobiales bacterium]
DQDLGCTLPHPVTYPHRWLWDSCFHAIAWAGFGRREAVVELASLLGSRLPTVAGRGFVPHMVYGDPWRRGGGIDRGLAPPPWLVPAAAEALGWLWDTRLAGGLLTIVHPWESGADISPRFDDWYGPLALDRLQDHDARLVATTRVDQLGVAVANPAFTVAPAAFNAIAADAADRLGSLTGAAHWAQRGAALAAAIDDQLWDEAEGLWADRADRPPGAASASTPTLDGALGALSTRSPARAEAALGQCVGNGRFAAPFGPRYVPASHPAYRPDTYWRGPAWPQLNFLLVDAADRHGLDDIAAELAATTRAGAWRSGFSEYWNPETGAACGATPQSWSTLAAVLPEGPVRSRGSPGGARTPRPGRS